MSDYNKSTNFTVKDTLPSGNSNKIVKGTELDIEFTNIASAVASKANSDSPNFTGNPTAPTATVGSNTTQLANTAFVQTALASAFTRGMILLWSGSIASIPTGWALCNGSNSTPDLRNKFVIGAYSDNAGVANTTVTGASTLTGGSKDAIVVSHTHTASSTDSGHSHSLDGVVGRYGYGSSFGVRGDYSVPPADSLSATGSGTANITTTISSTGSSATNANLPPYYALAYIMKT